MISFVWSVETPLTADAGGAETYTVGHVRELLARGVKTEIVTVGHGTQDGRQDFPDLPFRNLTAEQVSQLDTTVIFAHKPLNVTTKKQSYAILHSEPSRVAEEFAAIAKAMSGKKPIVPSKFATGTWGTALGIKPADIPVVYPFAHPAFAAQKRHANPGSATRVIYAGRLTPHKGIYTLIQMVQLQNVLLKDAAFSFTVTTAGTNTPIGQETERVVWALGDKIDVVPSRKTPQDMAALLGEHDVLVFPANAQYWHEPFGMLSIEAQKAGCRVVASNDGGLPETDCGGLILVEPDNPIALAEGLLKAARLGPMNDKQREAAAPRFTVSQSVDALLQVIDYKL